MEFEFVEDVVVVIDNMNEFEFFGWIICVNIVKLMKIKEGYSCVVWSEDSWLSKYVG